LPDSALIVSYLWARHASALRESGFELGDERFDDRALQMIVEGAMDSAINRFYLAADGVADAGYLAKQGERARRCLQWVGPRVAFSRPVTAPVLSYGCFLEWALFRKVVDLEHVPEGATFLSAWRDSGVGAGTEPS
jgi:hypothetical protein